MGDETGLVQLLEVKVLWVLMNPYDIWPLGSGSCEY